MEKPNHPKLRLERKMGRPAVVIQPLGIFYFIFLIFSISSNGVSSNITNEERKVYIVYMGSLPKTQQYSPSALHLDILQQVVDNRFVEKSLVRSYKRSFNGFAAYLTDQEQQIIAGREDVKLIFPSQTLKLHTTASWDFTKFHQNVPRNLKLESDIIVGVLDTGIWPESESFSDHGVGPVPKKWKGVCEGGKNFTCNKKIIGARNYIDEYSARDLEGHGSHTASTAAGNVVKNTSFYSVGEGTARGAVPSARIATYRICSSIGCTDDGILAAFDDAIADGVDILSVSLGSDGPVDIQIDSIAIGAFHAQEKGILTVQSAGNSGSYGSVCSIAPWIFTVAASTISRKFVAKVSLGNGWVLSGNAINAFKFKKKNYPLIDARNASKKICDEHSAASCNIRCLDKSLVKGKIVLCNTTETLTAIENVNATGGIGVILVDGMRNFGFVSAFPVSPLSPADFRQVVEYVKSSKPTGNFFISDFIEDVNAPEVAGFSSKGPNLYYPDILKPDITAPGVSILAAFSPYASPSYNPNDHRSVKYNILSGTSMSCPHVTGAAAYVKSFHPEWSPSAIKSALMTTAWKMNATNVRNVDAEFGYGAGHFNPTKAVHPGLVYETLKTDYIGWICGSNIGEVIGGNTSCKGVVPIQSKDLNYPTMSIQVEKGKSFRVTFPRTVKNVGLPNSIYKATISNNHPKLNFTVVPNVLSFKATYTTESFKVTVESHEKFKKDFVASASLEWFDGFHTVRSPIVVFT